MLRKFLALGSEKEWFSYKKTCTTILLHSPQTHHMYSTRGNNVKNTVSTSFQRGIHVVYLKGYHSRVLLEQISAFLN